PLARLTLLGLLVETLDLQPALRGHESGKSSVIVHPGNSDHYRLTPPLIFEKICGASCPAR
ncbi:MAG TPA: hypothetical protein VK687_11530, partial [Bryobacteraceae bacterium]|nr:hypothetical protein [Bryobacteraceae bacterium]